MDVSCLKEDVTGTQFKGVDGSFSLGNQDLSCTHKERIPAAVVDPWPSVKEAHGEMQNPFPFPIVTSTINGLCSPHPQSPTLTFLTLHHLHV